MTTDHTKGMTMRTENGTDYLTVNEAAQLAEVSTRTIWRRISDGTLAAYQDSRTRQVMVTKDSARAYAESLAGMNPYA